MKVINYRTFFLLVCFFLFISGVGISREQDAGSLPFITNVFFETDIRQALQDIAAQAGIPILADDTVQGYVTVEFKDTPLEQKTPL